MKIKIKDLPYEQVMALPRPKRQKPLKPFFLLQVVIRLLAILDLFPARFTYTKTGMEKIGKKQPCLILMNHSSFVDLKIASRIFFPKRYGIICTTDGFVGKGLLMRLLGCIPTQKFITDLNLIRDMKYMLHNKRISILMYPEAGYSFDGTTTTLPRKLGILMKKLDVPVVTVITKGAFHRDPLYNCLQKRKVRISAEVKCLASQEEVRNLSVAELDARLDEAFSFDNFRWQQENRIPITEEFRADGLERILYRCPHCGSEGKNLGKGTSLTCRNCGKQYRLTTLGYLEALEGETTFSHIPNWFQWQRGLVRQELENGTYRLETDVEIMMLVDRKALYRVGSGKLTHSPDGFRLIGCDGKLDYTQGPLVSHSLNADYYWYELGDVICIGNADALYYCFPKSRVSVAKARLAAEELYKLKKHRKIAINA